MLVTGLCSTLYLEKRKASKETSLSNACLYIYCMCKKVDGLIQGRIFCYFGASKAVIIWFHIIDKYISLNEAKYVQLH